MAAYVEHSTTAAVLLGVTIGVWLAGEIRQTIRRRPEATHKDWLSGLALRLLLAGGWVITATSREWASGAVIGGRAVGFGIGFAIAWLGLGLRWWAFWTLGRWFTVDVMTSPDQPVIDRGPYRVLRHPSYTGLILVLVGGAVMVGNWVGVAALATLPTIGLIARITVEEKALTAALGDAYGDFAQHRKRLVPYLW